MYYIIRRRHEITKWVNAEGEVLGIFNASKVPIPHNYPSLQDGLTKIVERNLNLTVGYWYWVKITQAEYETYRDLHGFHVITRT